MDNSVVIKGKNNGIAVVLDPTSEFEDLKEKVKQKFVDSSRFLGNCKTAVAFEGRVLSDEEEMELLDIITSNTDLEVVCLISKNELENKPFAEAPEEREQLPSGEYAKFYKGNLRSGQCLDMESSVIIIGDVNPGASVTSNGNIIVIGSLKGTAFAGAAGNTNAFVVALDMNPMQIRIADTIARSPDNPDKNQTRESKIAFLEDDNIYIEPVTKSVLNDIRI